MIKYVKLDDNNCLKFYYDIRNHVWVYMRLAFLDVNKKIRKINDSNDNSKNFIFDTGAQNTIISRRRAIECGYTNLPLNLP